MYDETPPLPVRIALDACLAGSAPFSADPASIAAARDLCKQDPAAEVAIVLPRHLPGDNERGDESQGTYGAVESPGLRPLSATSALGADEVARVRASRLSSVRVATKAVRDGGADIFVATGPPGPALAAAEFSFGLIQGASAPVLAWLVETETAPVILIGSPGSPGLDPVAVLLGEVAARALLGIDAPRVSPLAVTWPSNPSAASLVTGMTGADTLITPLATAVALLQLLAANGRPTPPVLVLGLTALAVLDVTQGSTADRLALAVRAVRAHVQEAVTEALGGLVRQRREAAGYGNTGPTPAHGAELPL